MTPWQPASSAPYGQLCGSGRGPGSTYTGKLVSFCVLAIGMLGCRF